MSFDLNSLYPHLIMQYNMSPETYNEQTPNSSFAKAGKEGYETYYRKDKQGVLPKIIKEYYDERVSIKKQMLADKKPNDKKVIPLN